VTLKGDRVSMPEPMTPVQALLKRISEGAITPQEAEQQALAEGLGPLLIQPDPAKFDPLREPFWTIIMTLVWIMVRSPDEVREVWDAFRCGHMDWHHHDENGQWSLRQRRPVDLKRLKLFYNLQPAFDQQVAFKMSVDEALRLLRRELQSGTIEATGIFVGSMRRERIAPVLWCDLKAFSHREQDYVTTEPGGNWGGTQFEQMLFPSAAVLAIWPMPGTAQIESTAPKSGAPGRPSSMHLIEQEFQRRVAEGKIEGRLSQQARVLADWQKATHPDQPNATPKTIENRIRSAFRRARNP
jgi:hypothetical protein